MGYIPYGRQFINKRDIVAVSSVLKSGWITQGPMVERFEHALASYCRVKYAVVVSSGTAALHLACIVAGLRQGNEAITSPMTFLATPNSVLYAGARPVFADIKIETANINPDEIKKKITRKTKAILPVHFAGLPCEMEEINAIATKKNLIVVEDACHALGAEYKINGRWIKVGSCTHSDMTVFSFHPVKHITTGEGGAITTNNKKFYERLKALRSHGVYKDEKTIKEGQWYYEMRELGFNYRITDFQCALGLSQLKKINNFIKRRREIVNIYSKELSDISQIELPVKNTNLKPSWHLYVIRLKEQAGAWKKRKNLFNYLRKNNIGAQVHYIPVYLQPYYRRLGYGYGECPVAEDYYNRSLTLPLYPSMDQRAVSYVITRLSSAFRELDIL